MPLSTQPRLAPCGGKYATTCRAAYLPRGDLRRDAVVVALHLTQRAFDASAHVVQRQHLQGRGRGRGHVAHELRHVSVQAAEDPCHDDDGGLNL